MPKLGLIIQLSESHVRDVCVAAGLTATHGGKDLFWFRLWEMQSEGGKGMGAGHLVTMATQALRGWRYRMGGHKVQGRGMEAEPTPPPVTPSLQLRLIFCGSHNPLKWWSHVGTKHSHTRACGTILKETTMKDFRRRRGVCVCWERGILHPPLPDPTQHVGLSSLLLSHFADLPKTPHQSLYPSLPSLSL